MATRLASFVLGAGAAIILTGTARAQPSHATIIRDTFGVPHTHAGSLRALYFEDGFAQAQDRLWQAEAFRRLATGTMAEWFGGGYISSDIQSRLFFGPASRRASLLAAAPEKTRLIVQSFVDGMNARIEAAAATGSLPPEYAAMGVSPSPWTSVDVVAVALLIAIGPSLSADGRALLLGGPQTGHTLPQFVHGLGLHGAKINAVGAGVPGVPGTVVTGRTALPSMVRGRAHGSVGLGRMGTEQSDRWS